MSSQANRNYYSARVATELALAAESSDVAVRIPHDKLAHHYAALLANMDDESIKGA